MYQFEYPQTDSAYVVLDAIQSIGDIVPELGYSFSKCNVEVLPYNKQIRSSIECALCAEIWPLNAIEMKRVADQKLPLPVVIQDKCNGCGKCQYRCPVKKKEEIFWFKS